MGKPRIASEDAARTWIAERKAVTVPALRYRILLSNLPGAFEGSLVTKLIVADDHRLVRECLRRVLEARKDLRVVAEAGDGEEAARLVAEHRPDIALVDLTMPRMSGLSAIGRISEETATRCIVVTMHEEFGVFTQAVEAGAAAYVVKSASSSELFDAIDAVRRGGSYLSPSIAHWAVE